MGTKILKKTLQNVWVPVSVDEREKITQFFEFRGMKSEFLKEHDDVSRKELYKALTAAKKKQVDEVLFKTTLLTAIRQFIADHIDEMQEFMKQAV